MLKRLSEKLENKMRKSKPVRFIVLAITAFNYIANTLLPFLLIVLGGADQAFHNVYVNLLWGLLLTIILIYYSQKTDNSRCKYFNDIVPAFLISAYFIAIIVIFLIKTAAVVSGPVLDTLPPFEIAGVQTNVWLMLNYVSYIVEACILYYLITHTSDHTKPQSAS